MDVPFKVMKSTLEKELNFYKEYVGICAEIRKHVVDSNIEGIRQCIKKQEEVAISIGELEDSRVLLAEELAQQFGMPPKELTLRKTAELSGDEELSKGLILLQERLRAMLKEVRKENSANALLFQESIKFIHNTFNIIAGVKKQRESYNSGGKIREEIKVSRNILNRVI